MVTSPRSSPGTDAPPAGSPADARPPRAGRQRIKMPPALRAPSGATRAGRLRSLDAASPGSTARATTGSGRP